MPVPNFRILGTVLKCSVGICLLVVAVIILIPSSIMATIGFQELQNLPSHNKTIVAKLENVTKHEIILAEQKRWIPGSGR
jgi:hypothetical protein